MNRFQEILLHVLPDSAMNGVIQRVRWLASHSGATVTVFGVIDNHISMFENFLAKACDEVSGPDHASFENNLKHIVQELNDEGIHARMIIGQGPEVSEILRQIAVGNHDLLVKARDRTKGTALWPSVDLQLLRQCPIALWLLHPDHLSRVQHLLAAVDLDSEGNHEHETMNQVVMEMATSLAAIDSGLLDVLHAWWMPEESGLRHGLIREPQDVVDQMVAHSQNDARWQLSKLIERFADPAVDMHSIIVPGQPAEVIPAYAKEHGVDTLIIGSEGRTGFANLLIGNTAENVLKQLHCSLLAVRPTRHVLSATKDL